MGLLRSRRAALGRELTVVETENGHDQGRRGFFQALEN